MVIRVPFKFQPFLSVLNSLAEKHPFRELKIIKNVPTIKIMIGFKVIAM